MENKLIVIPTSFELLEEGSTEDAFASVSLNPLFQWAKIVVTDDLPNANKMRISQDEFQNLINTGIFAPIKMAEKEISSGHDEAFGKPIGTITQLTKENNRIIALAALWKKERPEEIAMLKEMYKKGTPPNVSWEIAYASSEIVDGIEELKGTILTGLAVVGMPAYSGRTAFVAMSSKDKGDTSVEELETLKNKVTELETELANAKKLLADKETEFSQIASELDTLKKFKEAADKEKADAEKLAGLVKKFKEAGIEKDEEYFKTNSEMLLGLSDPAIDFMIQELVAFSASNQEAQSSTKVPDLRNKPNTDLKDPKEIAKALRERNTKK